MEDSHAFEIASFLYPAIQLSNIIAAVEYAVDNGAKIINFSLGGPSYSYAQYESLNYANQNGVLVVAAAGNESTNNDNTPFFYKNKTH